MKIKSAFLCQPFVICAILLIDLFISSGAMASNRAIDMKIIEHENQTRFVLMLESTPRYSLGPVNENRILLNLYNTVKTPLINKKMTGNKDSVALDEDEKSSLLRFYIRLSRPLREINSSWLADEKLLFLKIDSVDESDTQKHTGHGPATLKNIRFGIQEISTRMVVGLDRKPQWEIICREDNKIDLKLKAISGSLKRKRYGPVKRLKEVILNHDRNNLDISMKHESPLERIRIFWLKDGNRFVVDLFDRPEEINDKELLLTRDFDESEGQGTIELKENDNKIKEEKDEPDQTVKISTQEMGFMVRKKIPERQEAIPDPLKDYNSIHLLPKIINLTVESESGKARPDNYNGKELFRNLSSEEAFLFGRIQEAWENRDYVKGTEFINQFMSEFPDSTLNENISFLRGDFQLMLLKSGKKDAFNKTLKSYQGAIGRFRESRKVPDAYLKMALANSLMGNDYPAIGNLTMLINSNRKGDHLPRAYLERGKIYLRINQPEKAVEDFKTILDRYPHSTFAGEARLWIANYFHNIGVYEEAEKRLMEIGDSNPELYLEHPEYLFICARNYFYQKKYDQARDYYFRALNIGNQPEANDLLLCHIGDTYHQQSKEREAEKFYRIATDYYPQSEGASIAELRLANYSSGVSGFKEVHKKNVNKSIGDLALLKLAGKFYEKGQISVAMDTLKKLIEKPIQTEITEKARDLFRRSMEKEIKRLYHEHEYGKLIDFHQSAQAKLNMDIDPEALLLLARSFYNLHLYPQAISIFSEIKPYNLSLTSKGRYILILADSYVKEGDDESAKNLLEKNRKERLPATDKQKMTFLLADINKEKGELKNAYNLYQSLTTGKRLLSDTEIARAYLFMGEISNREKLYERAKGALNRCIALAEKESDSHELLQSAFIEMGNSYHSEGRHQQAIKSYRQGLDLGYGPGKSDYWETRFRLALSYLEIDERFEAERLLKEISEEGGPIVQQKVQVKLGMLGLENELKRLSIWPEMGE